jgi:hypothetical protein
MDKLDYKKQMKALYFPPAGQPVLIEVPEMQFVMVDGHGDPNTSALFRDAMQTLYGISYTIKFMLKKQSKQDYLVFPLEGLWWVKDMREFSIEQKDKWLWTVMIRQPEWVNCTHFKDAIEEIKRKKQAKKEPVPETLDAARLERFTEGPCAQVMHIGPFKDEGPTIAGLHQFIREQGFALRDKHHEIYMSDPRRTAREKLKTVIRQPLLKNLKS